METNDTIPEFSLFGGPLQRLGFRPALGIGPKRRTATLKLPVNRIVSAFRK